MTFAGLAHLPFPVRFSTPDSTVRIASPPAGHFTPQQVVKTTVMQQLQKAFVHEPAMRGVLPALPGTTKINFHNPRPLLTDRNVPCLADRSGKGQMRICDQLFDCPPMRELKSRQPFTGQWVAGVNRLVKSDAGDDTQDLAGVAIDFSCHVAVLPAQKIIEVIAAGVDFPKRVEDLRPLAGADGFRNTGREREDER
jgi:hypothetical protein